MREIKLKYEHTPFTLLEPRHKCQGYVRIKVSHHPFSDKRGYVPEHRLIMEEHLGRFLYPTEFIHHINQIRDDNRLENLVLQGQGEHAKEHMVSKRNPHGQFVCQEPIFQEIKFRLLNTNTNQMRIYTLQELIATTYRRGQFKCRGRWTGLKDKNGKEIYEGDIVKLSAITLMGEVKQLPSGCWVLEGKEISEPTLSNWISVGCEVIGNIYENKDLIE